VAEPCTPSTAWEAVVEADTRFVEALTSLSNRDLEATLRWALTDLSSRPVALRILSIADSSLTLSVLPALEPLLVVSHSLLTQCRGLVLRLARQERLDFLARLTERVVGDPGSDDEAYRRLAELLREAGAESSLAVLLASAAVSDDAEVREVADDFSGSTSG